MPYIKRLLPYCIALLCLIALPTAFAEISLRQESHYIEQDGVVYFVSADRADAIWIAPYAEAVILRGQIEGKPVHFEIDWHKTTSRAKTLCFEDGLQGVDSIWLEKWEYLEQVDVFMETEFVQGQDFYITQITLLSCPVLSAFQIHGKQNRDGISQKELLVDIENCPVLSQIGIADGYVDVYVRGNLTEPAVCRLPATAENISIPTQCIPVVAPENPHYQTLDDVLFHMPTHALVHYPMSKTNSQYTVPEGIQSIRIKNPNIEHINLPASVSSIQIDCERLIDIQLSPRNKAFCLMEGVLYSADMESLVYYPQANKNTAYETVNVSLTSITIRNPYLRTLTIPMLSSSSGVTLDCSMLEILSLPANYDTSVYALSYEFNALKNLHSIQIAPDNPSFRSFDGAIYTADGKELVYVPVGKTGTLTIDDGAEAIFCDMDDFYSTVDRASLYMSALKNCNRIERIIIPKSMTQVHGKIFEGNASLRTIEVSADHPTYQSEDGYLLTKDGKTLAVCPIGDRKHISLPVGIERIGPDAFPTNNTLESLTIPHGVRVLEENALSGNLGLLHASLPQTLYWVMDGAFEDCISLKRIHFPEGVRILEDAFSVSTPMFYAMGEYDIIISEIEINLPTSLAVMNDTSICADAYDRARLPEQVLLIVPPGHSFAQDYADRMKIPYRYADDPTLYNHPLHETYAMVQAPIANSAIDTPMLYSAPESHAAFQALHPGDMVRIRETLENGWHVVDLQSADVLYVPDAMLGALAQPRKLSRFGVLRKAASSSDTLAQRTSSSIDLPVSTIVHVTMQIGPWYQVQTLDGRYRHTIYVEASSVQLLKTDDKQNEATIHAMDMAELVTLHALPQDDAELLQTLFCGTVIEVLYDDGTWSFVQTDERKLGFVRSNALQSPSQLKVY